MSIKEVRESRSMTQSDVAKALGISRTTVAMWETGDSMPRADKLPELARLFGCRIDDLFINFSISQTMSDKTDFDQEVKG